MADLLMKGIGQRIKALREQHGLTQGALADVTGYTRSSIANVEAGRQEIPIRALAAVAGHFGVTLAALLGEAPMPDIPAIRVVHVLEVICAACGRLGESVNSADVDVAEEIRAKHVRRHLAGRA